jgi:hypothetical protein
MRERCWLTATSRSRIPDAITRFAGSMPSTDPFTGSRYTFGAGNPITNIEQNGHTQCDAGVCPTQRQINQVTARAQQDNPDLPVIQTFGTGIKGAAVAANSGTFEAALLAAQRAFQRKYGYLPASLQECAANPGGGLTLCGGKEMLDVTTFVHDYLCKQHGITCVGPVAANSPFASTLAAAAAAAGMMFGGFGHQGEGSWGNPDTLEDHFLRHGADFGATSAEEYAHQASEFFQRGLQEELPTKIDPRTGVIRIYDPATNTFGAYNPSLAVGRL